MNVEEQYQDVLQNLEEAIIAYYRENPELIDLEVEDESGEIQEVGLKELELEQLKPSEIVACLKKIQSSVKFWTKKHGRQGYLNFATKFI